MYPRIRRQLRMKARPQNIPLPHRNNITRIIPRLRLRQLRRLHLFHTTRQPRQHLDILAQNLFDNGCADKNTRKSSRRLVVLGAGGEKGK